MRIAGPRGLAIGIRPRISSGEHRRERHARPGVHEPLVSGYYPKSDWLAAGRARLYTVQNAFGAPGTLREYHRGRTALVVSQYLRNGGIERPFVTLSYANSDFTRNAPRLPADVLRGRPSLQFGNLADTAGPVCCETLAA